MKSEQPPFCPTIGFYKGPSLWKTWLSKWAFWRDAMGIIACFALMMLNMVGWSAMFEQPSIPPIKPSAPSIVAPVQIEKKKGKS